MSRIVWDQLGSRKYEVGVDRGVLYQDTADGFTNGVPWNGLIGIDTDSAGGDVTPLYSGDTLVDLVSSYDELEGTINAYTYPDEFDACIGSKEVVPGIFVQQQGTSRFGLSYRSLIGNDVNNENYGYKIHLIYNCELTKVSWSKSTINDSAELEELGFDFKTIPVISDDYDPYSELIIDSTKFSAEFMEDLEEILYGSEEESPRLPTLDELASLFFVEEPVPASWEGYPHDRVYPSTNLYPYDLPLHFDVELTIPARTLDVISVGRSMHAWTEPFIPVDATILSEKVIDIPAEYEDKISFKLSISDDREEITLEYRNISGEIVVISDDFDVTAKISYIVEEE